jgi:hypothetical protein
LPFGNPVASASASSHSSSSFGKRIVIVLFTAANVRQTLTQSKTPAAGVNPAPEAKYPKPSWLFAYISPA